MTSKTNFLVLALLAFVFIAVGLASSLPTAAEADASQDITAFPDTRCYRLVWGVHWRYLHDIKAYYAYDKNGAAAEGIGNWILYDEPNYQGESEVLVLRPDSGCVPYKHLALRDTSVRFAGHPSDYRLPSINFYEGPNYTGREIFVTDETPKALFGVSETGLFAGIGSLIVTGGSKSCWTLYWGVNFLGEDWDWAEGYHTCICGQDSPDFAPLLLPTNPFPPHNQVGSVRRGCVTSVTKEAGAAAARSVEGPGETVVRRGKVYQDGIAIAMAP